MANTQKNAPVTAPTDANKAGAQVNRPVTPATTADSPRNTRRDANPTSAGK